MIRGKLFKKSLSLVLALVLVVGLLPVTALAASARGKYSAYYVALGDGMTFGVGLDDPTTDGYYVKIAEALGAEDDWYGHAERRYRVEELRYLLDDSYQGDGYTKSLSKLATDRKNGIVKAYVTNAEVITLNIGVNNFSTYIIEQMMYYLENGGATKYSYSFDQFGSAELQDAMENVQGIVMDQLLAGAPDNGDKALEMIEYVTEVAVYSLMSYITSFNALVDTIKELNPDVQLYVIGLYNPAQGEVMTMNYHGRNVEIPIGEVFGALTELANAYTQILCHRVHDYIYVDPGTPMLLIDQMAMSGLSEDERIPDGLMVELMDLTEGAAVNEIKKIFADYGIEKTDKEAYDFLEELLSYKTDAEREAFIMRELNDLVVEEVSKAFKDKMNTALGQFADSSKVVTNAEIEQLLADLEAAADEAAREQVAEDFVDDLIANEELQNQAAAKLIYDKLGDYGLKDCVTQERVEQMLVDMGKETTDAGRRAVVTQFVHELAVAKVTKYVQGIVGESYTADKADAMLIAMEAAATPEDAKAIAKQMLWQDAFRGYMIDKISPKFGTGDGQLPLVGTTVEGFVDDIYAAGDDYATVVRDTIRASAAKKVADSSFGVFTQAEINTIFAGMDAESTDAAKKAYLKTALGYKYDMLGSVAWTAYESYVDAAESSIKLVGQFLDGVDQAATALADYNNIQTKVVGDILNMYADHLGPDGKLDLGALLEDPDSGLSSLKTLREDAVKAILDGYVEYQDAMEVAKKSVDTFAGYIDPIYELLMDVAETDKISLNDLVSVADKATTGGSSYIGGLVDDLMVGKSLGEDEKTAAYIALRYYLGNAMMIMPSATGHTQIANNVIKAIQTGKNVYSTMGYWANKVIDGTIDVYRGTKSFFLKPTSASGQVGTIINPDSYVALGGNITTGGNTYVQMLGDALAMDYKDVLNLDEDFVYNYGIDGLRAEDLLVLVNNNYAGDAYTEGRFGAGYLESLRAEYQASIKDADLITIEVGINNLVTYPMTQTLLAYQGEDVYEMDWGQYFGSRRANQLKKGKNAMFDMLLGIVNNDAQCEKALNTVSTAVESLAYSLLGYIFHLDDAVESIAELNENGTIVMVGFYNPLNDTYLKIDKEVTVAGKSVDLSKYSVSVSAIVDKIINIGNRYLANYVGNTADHANANDAESRLVNVTILDTQLKISDYNISKDLTALADYKEISVNGKSVTLKVPEYFLKAGQTAGEALHPNANGHKYICDRILAMLKFEIHADVMPGANEKFYGDADPELFANWDDASSLFEGATKVNVTRETGEAVGTYKMKVTVEKNGGYYEIDVPETEVYFTIKARPVTLDVVIKDGNIEAVTVANGSLGLAFEDVIADLNLAYVDGQMTWNNANYDLKFNVTIKNEEIKIGVANIYNCTLNLEGEIHYNFLFTLNDFDMSQIKSISVLKFDTKTDSAADSTIDNADAISTGYYWDSQYGCYVARSVGIPAKNMGDDGWYKLCVEMIDGQLVYSNRVRFSAREYSQRALNGSYSDELKALCVALMNYGAAAQKQFNYKENALMNTFISDSDQARVADYADSMINNRVAADKNKHGVFTNPNTEIFGEGYKTHLTLLGAITLNVKINYNAPTATESGILVWSEEDYLAADVLTLDNCTNRYVIGENGLMQFEYTGISAKNMHKTVFMCGYVIIGDQYYYTSVFRTSVDYYAQKIMTESGHSAEMVELAKYMVVYGEYAYNYFY